MVSASSEAVAQQVSPSDGVLTPMQTIVERDDAQSLELNPAGLAHIEGFELQTVFGDYNDDLREGFALMLATSPMKSVGLGYSFQAISPGLRDEAFRKHTFGLAVGDRLTFGVNANFFGSEDERELDELMSIDLGLQYHMFRWLGFGMMLRDANTPFFGDASIDPQLTLGAALRLYDGRLLFEADAVFDANSPRVRPRFVLAVEPLSGVRLFSQLLTDTGEEGDEFDVVGVSGGLEVNLANVGVSGSGLFGSTGGAGADGNDDLLGARNEPTQTGYSAALRFSSAGWRPLFEPGAGSGRFAKIKIGGDLPERRPVSFFGAPNGQSFYQLLETIRRVRDDDRYSGAFIELRGVSMGYGQAWELRRELERLREAGKPVVAYMHTPGQKEFYLASAADKVWMGPMTTFTARGLSISQAYYRGALDKLGVKADFIRIAEYKSAPEAFTREAPSEASEEALTAFIDAIWGHQLKVIGNGRGLSAEQLQGLIDTSPHDPGQAISAGLVDRVLYPDEIKAALKEDYGGGAVLVSARESARKDYGWGQQPVVLVLHIDGTIVSGGGGVNPLLGSTMTGDRTITRIAKAAARSPLVKAVVVRIDSPGGSATASDLMYRALTQLGEKKPLIVSMGDIAASGGYYVAAPGEQIYCNPTTLTGSIGIYSGKFALRGLYQKVGYNKVTTRRGERADLYSLDDEWTPDERSAIKAQISYLYDLFLSQVQSGREMDREALEAVAGGRIWSGIDAQRVGLCDVHGGLLDAIEAVAAKANLEEGAYRVVQSPSGNTASLLSAAGLSVEADDALGLGVDLAQGATLDGPLIPALLQDDTDARIYEAYAPLRHLLAPLRPAIDLGVLFADGEALALLPFKTDY